MEGNGREGKGTGGREERRRTTLCTPCRKFLEVLEAMDLTRDRSDWRKCTARCAPSAGGRTEC